MEYGESNLKTSSHSEEGVVQAKPSKKTGSVLLFWKLQQSAVAKTHEKQGILLLERRKKEREEGVGMSADIIFCSLDSQDSHVMNFFFFFFFLPSISVNIFTARS